MDLLAAASRNGAVAVWRISEAEGGLRSEALLSLLLRDAAGEQSFLGRMQAHVAAVCTQQGTRGGCVRACAAADEGRLAWDEMCLVTPESQRASSNV